MKLLVIGVVACLVLFVVAVLAPRRSRTLQRRFDRVSRRAEGKAYGANNVVGRGTGRSLTTMRRAADKSAHAGRIINSKAKKVASSD